jgi:hypothetical protein
MTLQEFSDASCSVQHQMVQLHGAYLLSKSNVSGTTSLYQLDQFYVVIQKSRLTRALPLLRSFSIDAKLLDAYLSRIDLSAIKDLF